MLVFGAAAVHWLLTGSALAGCLTSASGLVSWWPADGHANDLQDGNFGLPQNGAAFAAGKVGLAFSLDGTNDFVTIPHNTNLNPSGAFSINAWIKANPAQLSPDHQFVIVDKSHGFTDGTGWALQGNPDGTVAFFFGKGGGSGNPANFVGVSTLIGVLDDRWHHLSGVFTGTRFEIYFDGALNNTNAFSGAPAANTRDVSIGRSWGGGSPTRHFRGCIDEVEFFDRALTSEEVAAIFAAGGDGQCKPCTPPPPALVAWWPGDGSANDILGTNRGTLLNGATFAAGKVGAAFSLDGVDDLVSVADSPSVRLGPASPMTLALWVYRTSSNRRQHFLGKRSGCTGSSTEGTYQLYLNTDTAEGVGFANPGGACACSGQDLPLNTWTHLAGTFDGAVLGLYINGQLVSTTAGSLGPANAAPLLLGGSGACEKFGGLLDEVEIFSRALSSSESAALYTAGSTGQCRSCAPPPPSLLGWWPGDGQANDSLGTIPGSLQGNTTFAAGAVGPAFSFDGVGDAVTVGNPLSLQRQDFTINAWVKRTDAAQITRDSANPAFPDGLVFSYGHFGYGFGLRQDGTACRLFLTKVDMNDVTSGALQITDLDFHHVAVTKSNSTVVFYLDGAASPALAYDPGFTFTTSAALGARGDNLRNSVYGLLDEVGIFSRALTAAEIQTIVTAGSLGQCKTPLLSVSLTPANGVLVSWPAPDLGWVLEFTTGLVSPPATNTWTDMPPPYQNGASNLYHLEPAPAGSRFYRLFKP